MAISPVSGSPSPVQLAVMEQIRALRAAKNVAPVQGAAPVQSTAPVQARPAAAQSSPAAQALSMATGSGAPPANRPRGSILNIIA
ncbi:MAG TPA: hypothetical protein VGF92_10130 [Stellaceae bacterium]